MESLKKIDTSTLKEGMMFSAPLFFDDGENMFLPKGHVISEYHLGVLSRWKLKFVLTEGHPVTEQELAEEDEPEEPEELDELEELEELDEDDGLDELEEVEEVDEPEALTPESCQRSCRESAEVLERVFQSYKAKKSIDRSVIDGIAETILKMVDGDQTMILTYILNAGQSSSLSSAAINIAIISAAVALRMQLPKQRITQLVIAALLHDIAMMQVPSAIINKKNMLTSQEFELLKLHTLQASRFVTDTLFMPREVGNIVMQHHERWDGSGYPAGRKGADIDLSARILAIADTFEALVGRKSYHDAIISYEAVKQLLAESGTHFDSEVMKQFVLTMGVYPVGSVVQLSDGSSAVVIQGEPEAPFLPVVQLQGAERRVIKLKQQNRVFIVRVVSKR